MVLSGLLLSYQAFQAERPTWTSPGPRQAGEDCRALGTGVWDLCVCVFGGGVSEWERSRAARLLGLLTFDESHSRLPSEFPGAAVTKHHSLEA